MLPDLETIRNGLPNFDPNWGTLATDMCQYLHDYYINTLGFPERYLAQPYYSHPMQDVWQQIVRHTGKNYSVVTGTYTNHLADWTLWVSHINATVGYGGWLMDGWYVVSMSQIRYAETATAYHGYTGGKFKIWHPAGEFWGAVYGNNVQCVLKDGI